MSEEEKEFQSTIKNVQGLFQKSFKSYEEESKLEKIKETEMRKKKVSINTAMNNKKFMYNTFHYLKKYNIGKPVRILIIIIVFIII